MSILADRLGDRGRHRFERLENLLLAPERTLEVELGELELAIGPEVLVAVAAGYLVVALDPGDHQELLEELRRLGQGVEAPCSQARRDEHVPGAFGGGGDQRRGLDLHETQVVHHVRIARMVFDRARTLSAIAGRLRSR